VFKNLLVYRVTPGWDQTVEGMEAGLQALPFVECGAGMEKSAGWVPPRGEPHGPLVESVGGQRILKLMTEVKLLPASVVARKAKERAQKIEAATGRKPGKKETRDLKEDIRHELLPQAFTKQGGIWVWIDPVAKRLMIDAGSPKKADEVVTLLVQCLQGFAVTLVNTSTSPAVAMGRWLTTQEPPQAFSVDRECELKAADESKAVVRYARHPLDIDEVRSHIESGKQPTRVALTWKSRVSLVLTDALQIRKLGFLDVVFESATAQGKDDGFDADVAIATSELAALIPDLLDALDGEAAEGQQGKPAVFKKNHPEAS
jgi:recombination associated protein RdgC